MGSHTPQTNVRLSESGRALLTELCVTWGSKDKPMDKGATVEKALGIAKAALNQEAMTPLTKALTELAKVKPSILDSIDPKKLKPLPSYKPLPKFRPALPPLTRAPIFKPKGKLS